MPHIFPSQQLCSCCVPPRMLSTFPLPIYPLKDYAFFKVNFKCPALSCHSFFISPSECHFASFNSNFIWFVFLSSWLLLWVSVCLTFLPPWNCKVQESESCALLTLVSLASPGRQKETACKSLNQCSTFSLTKTNTQIIHFEIWSPTRAKTRIASYTGWWSFSSPISYSWPWVGWEIQSL